MHTKFWSGNMNGRDHIEELGVDGKVILRVDLRRIGWDVVDSSGSG